MLRLLRGGLTNFVLTSMLLVGAAKGEQQLDLALVIAVDVSSSMEPDEQSLQRRGYIEALRSSLVHEAIRDGVNGSIAVTYVEWSGTRDQVVLIPWTIIDSPEKAEAFARQLSQKPMRQSGMTSLSSVIDFSVALFSTLEARAVRRTIDISGDGPNNDGEPVTQARDRAVAQGITINGLPIMFKKPGYTPELADLDLYYRECVIGGPSSFMIPVHDIEQFAMVIRSKILREVAGKEELSSLIVPVESTIDCVTGEKDKEEGPPRQRKP